SRRLRFHETATGSLVSVPPRDSQPPQLDPSHQRCQSAWSVPRAKTSSRSVSQATAEGTQTSTPPRDSQPPQLDPSHQRCQSPLSAPMAKTSSRFGPQDTATGGDSSTPPRDSQPLHEAASRKGYGLSFVRPAEVPGGKWASSRPLN